MTLDSFLSYSRFGESSLESEVIKSPRYSFFPQDGLHMSQPDSSFIEGTTTDLIKTEGDDSIDPNMPQLQYQMGWPEIQMWDFPENSYNLSPSNFERVRNDLPVTGQNEALAFEYTWSQNYGSEISTPTEAEPGFSSEYLLNSFQEFQPYEITDLNRNCHITKETQGAPELLGTSFGLTMVDRLFNEIPMDSDRKSTLTNIRTSDESIRDGGNRNPTAAEERTPDRPYAKLIYEALMGAPDHTMALQEIYQWFIDHTEKGNSASTGWRNSVRHNLSMNAAFRKTSRKFKGGEVKRTSEWVLEPSAIGVGVTPTTRYRKNCKRVKSENPSQARLRSDRAGGHSTRKAKYLNQKSKQVLLSHTHGCHQTSTENYSRSESNSFDGSVLCGDVNRFHTDNGSLFFVQDHGSYGDRHPYMWSNFPC